jgi:signal transduction histidine kinase
LAQGTASGFLKPVSNLTFKAAVVADFRPHFSTLRFKLTALYTVVFGLLLTAMGVVIIAARQRDLREQFDERLKDRVAMIVEEIAVPPNATRGETDLTPRRGRVSPFRFPGYFFQVRLEDGRVMYRSANLQDRTLPLSEAARVSRRTNDMILETVVGQEAGAPSTSRAPLRLLTVFHHDPDTRPFYLQTAVSTDQVNRSVRRLRRIVFITVPVALAAAGIVSWLLAGRALAPITRVTRAADEMRADRFPGPIEVPKGRDEVADMVARLNLMFDRLSSSFVSQERFIADAAHELKTPLAVLLGQAQLLLKQDPNPEAYNRFIISVQDEVRLLAQTVDSLLTLARAEAGMPLETANDVQINEMVMDAVQRCNTAARQREVQLVPVLAMPENDEQEPVIRGDGGLLRLMMSNLIRNAIRYSPVGEVVDVAVHLEAEAFVLTVRDRGPGIPPNFIDRVFDRFFRAPDPHSSFKGVGLGLTIVRGVARLHGGDVTVTNHPDGGCAFKVRLPLAHRQ